MGIGYNLLSIGGIKEEHKLHIQSNEPQQDEGLWIKTDIKPSRIISMRQSDIEKRFVNNWDILNVPSGYRTFAVVGNNMYLLGNSSGKYLKANLQDTYYQWSNHNAGSNIEFTNTDVIGSKIYATHEGNSLNVYQMDTTDETPTFTRILPTLSSFKDPKICSYGNYIFAISGGTTSEQKIMRINTFSQNPAWEHIRSIYEDTSMSSIIVNNDILYIIGVTYYGEKCYAIDLLDSDKKLNILSGFKEQGVLSPALSSIGGKVRILNCGFAEIEKNTLTLIDGIWKGADHTDLTQLQEIGASYSRAYHTNYALFVKEYMEDNLIYRLRRVYPSIDLEDNTLIITKDDKGKFIDTGKLNNYNIKENIYSCYYSQQGNITKVPVAYYNVDSLSWEEMAIED